MSLTWVAFQTAMSTASEPSTVLAALEGFKRGLTANPVWTQALSKAQIAGVAMSKRRQNTALWSKEVALAFRTLMESFQAAEKAAAAGDAGGSGVATPGGGGGRDGKDGKGPIGAPAPAPAAPLVPMTSVDVSTCHAALREYFRGFYQPESLRATSCARNALTALQRNKDNRVWVAEGNGVDHIIYLLNRSIGAHHSEMQVAAVRLTADAALHDETEPLFFNKGAMDAAMRLGREATDSVVRGHAARLFFNLSYLRPNRPRFVANGAMEHIEYLSETPGNSEVAGTPRRILLSAVKTLVQLCCHDACIKPVLCYSKFVDIWNKFARHSYQPIRQRAAVVFNQCIKKELGTDARFKPIVARMANEVIHGRLASDTRQPKAVQAVTNARTFVRSITDAGASSATATLASLSTPTVSGDCDPLFIEYFRKFTSADLFDVRENVKNCLATLQGNPELRANMARGNGVQMVMYVVQRASPGGPNPNSNLLLVAVRLAAESALNDTTETEFFRAGMFELATHLARTGTTWAVRRHAARLAFNLTFLRANRPLAVDKGALDHIEYIMLHLERDDMSARNSMQLSTAKMAVQLACHAACSTRLFQHPAFNAVWLAMASSPQREVRQRAATVFNKVAMLNVGGPDAHRAALSPLLDELRSGLLSTDTMAAAVTARGIAASLTAHMPSVDVDDCDSMFQTFYRGFSAADDSTVLGCVQSALATVQTDKSRRPRAAQGSGVRHILNCVNSAKANSETERTALRLAAEVALHDETEDKFFSAGALELAMRIAKTTADKLTMTHATRFFFNLTYMRANRPKVLDKGGLEFISTMMNKVDALPALQRKQMMLHLAKAVVQLACHAACVRRVADYEHIVSVWCKMARFPNEEVRARAAKIFSKVAIEKEDGLDLGFTPRFHPMVVEVTTGGISRDRNPHCAAAAAQGAKYTSS